MVSVFSHHRFDVSGGRERMRGNPVFSRRHLCERPRLLQVRPVPSGARRKWDLLQRWERSLWKQHFLSEHVYICGKKNLSPRAQKQKLTFVVACAQKGTKPFFFLFCLHSWRPKQPGFDVSTGVCFRERGVFYFIKDLRAFLWNMLTELTRKYKAGIHFDLWEECMSSKKKYVFVYKTCFCFEVCVFLCAFTRAVSRRCVFQPSSVAPWQHVL